MTRPLVRIATTADADQIGGIHARASRAAYRALVPTRILDRFDTEDPVGRWRRNIATAAREVFVSIAAGDTVGFCSVATSRDAFAPADCGEVTALYVDPASWRRGHGRLLIAAARECALGHRWTALTLWVLSTNHAARAFYSSLGFASDGAEKTEADLGLPEVRYRASV